MSGEGAGGHLLHNIVLFGRFLRCLQLDVTPTRLAHLVQAIQYLDLGSRRDLKNAARALLVSRREHLKLFDRAFDLFWRVHKGEGRSVDLGLLLKQSDPLSPPLDLDSRQSRSPSGSEPEEIPEQSVRTYSAVEVLRHKDFTTLSPAELAAVKQLIQNMGWDLEGRRTRRKIRSRRGPHLDLRRTLRKNLRHGGEPLTLQRRRLKEKRRPLVVLCDVSGSMEPYSRLLLQFIYVITNGLEKVEAFVFGTRLTRITRHLSHRNIDRALSQATEAIRDWAGGTRIGEAFKTFNYQWARRVLGQGALVLVISDGWDRGDVTLLEKETHRLQRSCQRLMWLNPLLGSPRYEPLTRGIQAVLPHVDDFLPIHNLASLEQLGLMLERLSEHRRVRHRPARPRLRRGLRPEKTLS